MRYSLASVLACFAIFAVLCGSEAVHANVYWDPTNGTTAGTGSATPSATWVGALFVVSG
jgi:hypothetical protein